MLPAAVVVVAPVPLCDVAVELVDVVAAADGVVVAVEGMLKEFSAGEGDIPRTGSNSGASC